MTARLPVTHLLYLHGFRSSPQSFKARRLAAWLAAHRPAVHWHCPQLPPSAREALRGVLAQIDTWPRETTAIVGSSLGGFYAMAVAERLGAACRAVLLNPAVDPARDWPATSASRVAQRRALRVPRRGRGAITDAPCSRIPSATSPSSPRATRYSTGAR
jgi:pimeloyl-ACP methyl ester carboxylesterase